MAKKLSALIFMGLTLAWFQGVSQSTDEERAVKEVIVRLFKAMEAGDSAMLHSAFAPAPTTATVFRDQNNTSVLRQENSIESFLKAVGTPHKEVWYEEIWNVKIQLDGDFAQAWCDYAFYTGNTFSHCGVDAFHLHKGNKGWKIFHLADTRRKTGCQIPREIQNKHQ
jgi:hypothetical protein